MNYQNKTPGRGDGAGAENTQSDFSISDLSTAGKALAMLWFHTGARTLQQTQKAFRQHSNWRSA